MAAAPECRAIVRLPPRAHAELPRVNPWRDRLTPAVVVPRPAIETIGVPVPESNMPRKVPRTGASGCRPVLSSDVQLLVTPNFLS